MLKSLPIGISDFKRLRETNCYYVDKSLFIKEILENDAEVVLLPRPRRFGKTLNLSMLQYFFEKTDENYGYLFNDLAINKVDEKYIKEQGKYPVIFLTFKDAKEGDFETIYFMIKKALAEEYNSHEYLLIGDTLNSFEKECYKNIMEMKAEEGFYRSALKDLSRYLARYHNENVMILIDEYDAPIQEGYLRGYYDQIVSFMRSLLSGGLKDNKFLKKGVMTGILRVAKESVFSGLNNLSVYSLLGDKFNRYFGMLENEVENFLKYYGLANYKQEIKEWYNGYRFGGEMVYNPWSVVKYIENKGETGLYWVNTSGNDLVRKIITQGVDVKKDLQLLLNNQTVQKEIVENVVYSEIENNTDTIWSFFLFSGYLRVEKKQKVRGRVYCDLKIPNLEVHYLYEDIIVNWFKGSIKNKGVNILLNSLTTGNVEAFSDLFQEFVLSSMSYFDISGDEPEKIYHAFILGMMVYLNQDYEIRSNRESGFRRYDVMLIPKKSNMSGERPSRLRI